jgi:hypothetical protein
MKFSLTNLGKRPLPAPTAFPYTPSNMITRRAQGSPAALEKPVSDDKPPAYNIGEDGLTPAELKTARRIANAIFERPDLEGLLLVVDSGKIDVPRSKRSGNRTFFVVLDFSNLVWRKHVLSFRFEGLEGFEGLSFRGAFSITDSKGSYFGGGSLVLRVEDTAYDSGDESSRWKTFSLVRFVDHANSEYDGAVEDEVGDESDAKSRKTRTRVSDSDEGSAAPKSSGLGKEPVMKKAAPEIVLPDSSDEDIPAPPRVVAEKEDPKGKEEASSQKISADVVTFMAMNRQDLIDQTVAVLTERYTEIVNKAIWEKAKAEDWEGQCRKVIEAQVREEGWLDQCRLQIETEIRQETEEKVKEELEGWTVSEKKRAAEWVARQWEKKKQQLAKLEETAKASWTSERAAEERRRGREELAKEINEQALAAARKTASQTPGLDSLDMAEPPGGFELNTIMGAVKKVHFQ